VNTPALSLCVVFLLAVSIPAGILILSSLLGPRRPNPDKQDAYECGLTPESHARHRIPVKFYLVAVFFILFDVEVAFMYPWAVKFRELGLVGFIAMASFMLVMGVGLIYILRKGALRWD